MATADELLSTLDTDKTLIIDKDLRIITIPSSVKNLGVESDDDVLRLKFSMPRMYGDVDLSDFSIYINYMNAKNTGDVYVVDDKTIADDTITFSWLVGRVALAYKGSVRFIVCMKLYDSAMAEVIKEYNTTIASLPVLEGLETSEAAIEQNPDILTYINELINMKVDIITPTIGDNGNWYLGDTDTNKPSRGEKGADGATGATGADGKSAYSYAVDGGYTRTEKEFAEKLAQEQLTGTTSELTPAQVYDAVSSGIPVKVQYTDSTYGLLSFTAFNVAESLNVIVSQTIVYYNSMYILAELYGNKSNNTWGTAFTTLAQKTDIPSALPNPYPLTFTGAVNETYDGSSAKTIEIPSRGGGGSGMNLSLVYENTFESVASINETIDALNGKENFVFNIEFTIPSDSTTAATITNADLYNGEFNFPIAYYVGYGNYSTSYPKKAAYGSFLKLGEGLWERIRFKAVSTEMFGDWYNLVTGDSIAFQYLKDNQNSHAAGLRIAFNQTMESVKIQIYAG